MKKLLYILLFFASSVQAQTYTHLYVSDSMKVGTNGTWVKELTFGSVAWRTMNDSLYKMDSYPEHVLVDGNNYYVAPADSGGSDVTGDGSFENPWASWAKLDTVNQTTPFQAGDSIFFMGGIYKTDNVNQYFCRWNNFHGNSLGDIVLMSYPGDTAIYDFSGLVSGSSTLYGLQINNCSYLHVYKLWFRNAAQPGTSPFIGNNIINSHDITMEWVWGDSIGGQVFKLCDEAWYTGDTNQVMTYNIHYLNCDASKAADPTSPTPYDGADGFGANHNTDNPHLRNNWAYNITYENCRAWYCTDDGWDFFNFDSTGIVLKGCWSVRNGYLVSGSGVGNGQGFKLGPNNIPKITEHQFTIQNCIAANNLDHGFDQNTTNYSSIHILYNNLAINNGTTGFNWGYRQWYPAVENTAHVFRNNASVGNTYQYDFTDATNIDHTYNSWNGGVTITTGDFAGTDWTELIGPRQADGSLPDITSFKLVTGSDLIDAGTDVGLSYEGSAPDIGAYERAGATSDTTNWYVDATGGDDSWSGHHPDSAKQTISAINAEQKDPGDTVFFKRDETWWDANITPNNDGTQELPIVWTSYGSGARPKLFGADSAFTFEQVNDTIWRTASNGYTDPYDHGDANMEVWFKTADSTAWGIHVTHDGSYTNYDNEFDWSYSSGYIYFYVPSGSDPSTLYSYLAVPSQTEVFDYNQGNGSDPDWQVYDGLEVAYTEVCFGRQEYPAIALSGFEVRNCYLHHTGVKDGGGKGTDIIASHTIIEDNTIREHGRRSISIYNYGNVNFSNITVRNNTGGDSYHTVWTDMSVGGGSVGSQDGGIDSILIYNNRITTDPVKDLSANPPVGCYFRAEGGSSYFYNVYIYNNIFEDLPGSGITISGDAATSDGFDDVYIEHNTFYGNNPSTTTDKSFIGFSSIGGDVKVRQDVKIRNNVFYFDTQDEGGNRLFAMVYGDDFVHDSITDQDGNLYARIDSETKIVRESSSGPTDYAMTSADLASMQSAWSLDVNSPEPVSDPYLNSSFVPYEFSSAVDSGVVSSSFAADDINGVSRSNPPNIGAVETVITLDTCTSFAMDYTAVPDSFDVTTSGCDSDVDTFALFISDDDWTDSSLVYSGSAPPSGRYFYDAADDGTEIDGRLYHGVADYNQWSSLYNRDSTLVDSSGVAGYTATNAEYQDVWDEFTTKPDDSIAYHTDTCYFTRYKALLDSWDDQALFILNFAAHTNDNGEALINWANIDSTHNVALENSPAFAAFNGITGSNSSNAYVSTEFNFSYYLSSVDSLFVIFVIQHDLAGNSGPAFEAVEGGTYFHSYPEDSEAFGGRHFSGSWQNSSTSVTDHSAIFALRISGGDTVEWFRNGVSLGTGNAGSTVPDAFLEILRAQGTESDMEMSRIGIFLWNPTDTEVGTATQIEEDYQDHLGTGVQ